MDFGIISKHRAPYGELPRHAVAPEVSCDRPNIEIEQQSIYKYQWRRRLMGLGTLVIGANAGWKQAVKLGKRTHQNIVQIPHARFIEMLTYKAQRVGIQVIVTEESYTSKCSFLDGEAVCKH